MQLSPEELAALDRFRPRTAHRWSEPRGRVGVYAVLDHGTTPVLGEVCVAPSADPAEVLEHGCRLARSFGIRLGLLGVARGGAAVVVTPDPQLDRALCLELLRERLSSVPVRALPGAGLLGDAASLGDAVHHDADTLARLRGHVLEACLRPVLPSLEGSTAVVLGASPSGRDAAAALQQRGVTVSLWDPDPEAARALAEALALPVLEGSWLDADVDVLLPCGPAPLVDGPAAERLAARIVCGAAPRAFATPQARETFEARERWAVPEILSALAEPLALALAEGLVTEADALARVHETAREVLTTPRGAHGRALDLAAARSKAAQATIT